MYEFMKPFGYSARPPQSQVLGLRLLRVMGTSENPKLLEALAKARARAEKVGVKPSEPPASPKPQHGAQQDNASLALVPHNLQPGLP